MRTSAASGWASASAVSPASATARATGRPRTSSEARTSATAPSIASTGIGGQQPAPEVARLHAQVDEQRQRHRHQHQPAHQAAPELERPLPPRRRDRRRPAEAPGQALEVVAHAAGLLARLGLVGRHLGLAAQVVPEAVEVGEEIRVERGEQHQRGQHAAAQQQERPAAVGPQPRRRGDPERQQRQPRRVLEGQREPGARAGQQVVAPAAGLGHAYRAPQRQRHPEQRAHVGHGHARVGHRQECERQQRRRHQPLAHAPQPPGREVGGGHAEHAQHRGQRARRDPDGGRVLVELVGDVAERQVEAERPVHHPQQAVDEVGVAGGVLVVAGVEALAEHLHRAVGEVGALVDPQTNGSP